MGWPSVEWGLRNISSAEITEWMAYYQLHPFGDERADLRAAIVSSTVANVNRGKGKKAFKPEDFMPEFRSGTQTVEEQIGLIALLTEMYGGTDLRGE